MAATATLGKVEEFDGTKEDWQQYVERLDHFFAANGITEAEQKRAVFLTVIGPATYKLVRNLVSPKKPGEKTYGELVEALSKHFKPTPSEIVERCKFHSRFRKPGESVATFVSQLRCLSEFCNFGDTLEAMIRDRLVCGINDDAIQKRLLAEPGLTYAKAVELSQSMEMAVQNVKELKAKPVGSGATLSEGNATHSHPRSMDVCRVANQPGRRTVPTCYRCGRQGHVVATCKVKKDIVCHLCGRAGHLQRACKSQQRGSRARKAKYRSRTVCRVQGEEEDGDESDSGHATLCQVRSHGMGNSPPIEVKVQVDDCLIKMEVDTGAAMSLMSERTFGELWPGRSLSTTEIRLQSYSKEPIQVVGCCYVNVAYNGQEAAHVPLMVVEGSGPSLLGRNWLSLVRLDWKQICHVHIGSLQAVLDRHPTVFQEGLGTLKGFEARIHIDPNATPRFSPARSVPYALRDKVDKELSRLVEEGTLEPVEISEWAAPIVPVLKSDKQSVRICGDFRVTVNPVSKLDRYPIPRVEDLFARLSKGKLFTKLDLSQAYQQLPLDDESKRFVVINTHKGLFRYTRLPFGISSAPRIFQRVIESILQGNERAVVYLDSILITGSTEKQHLETLEEVLSRLDKAGLRLKAKKCEFMKPSVTYLGHKIDAAGLHPLPDKVKAITDAPSPRSVQELKAYLGMLTYYSKFLPNLSTTLHPLYHLLKKDVPWAWRTEQEKAFTASKNLLTSATFLTHFDSNLKLTLACDASGYGLGAVLAHKMPDGSEKPIGYASRTLTKSECNYSQLEKEGLACISGIKKFHDYVFGHAFELVTDHKPLLGLLKEDRPTSPQASARIKRWSLFLSGYEYTLEYRNTKAHANADALSRLPLPVEPATTEQVPELVLLAEHLADSPVTADDIRTWTRRDPKLSRVLQYLQQGWPKEVDAELERYSSKRLELSIYDGCILWGSRVVVPEPGREAVLRELHEGHPGITKMKALARMYVWWPGVNADIEKSVRLCTACQESQPVPPAAPLNPWKWPSRPWARLHVDFAGPFLGKTFFIAIDTQSKWIEAACVASTSSVAAIEELRTAFAKFGLPETIVSDNGPGFVSDEFEEFLRKNGIKHTTSSPYHPASNGLAERAVQIVKKGLKKVKSGSISARLAKVLFTYRITPQSTTGLCPAELLLGRRPRTRLDLLKPHTAERVEAKQLQQKVKHDATAVRRTFRDGDTVFIRNYSTGCRWLLGKIIKTTGPVSFLVQLEDGREKRCHQDQLRHRAVEEDSSEMSEVVVDDSIPLSSPTASTDSSETENANRARDPDPPQPIVRTYPRRQRKPREWFEPGKD